jgi:Protein kinase domain/PEGA domain
MAGERPSQKYQLGGLIGGGGMAEVFEATLVGAEGFLRPVAVKRIQPALSRDPTFGQMFVNEARIASLLHHPNIVGVLDFDQDDEGRYFLVMELIRGTDLRRLMESGRLPFSIGIHIAAEMLRGLDYAHELEHDGVRLGIVHRDISPHNVMISWDGSVKLVDFGIAKAMAATGISRVGTVKGKVAYMSPEQANALEIDGRTDVFAVGVVLHEILVGERLFRGTTEPEILARLLTQPIPRPLELAPDIPGDLDRVVMKMLERDRDARYPSAHAALEALLATSATSARSGLELVELLADRFPGEGPRRRGSISEHAASASPQAGRALAATIAAGPAGKAAAAHAVRGTSTAPVAAAATPSSGGRAQPARDPAARRRRWRAGVLIAVIAAGVTAGTLVAREQLASRVEAEKTAAEIDQQPPDTVPETAPETKPETQPETQPPGVAASATAQVADAGADREPATDPDGQAERERESTDDRSAARERRERRARRDREARRGEPGQLHVVVDPWANLSVDGKSYGQTPLKVSLPPGSHRVVLRNTELGRVETITVKIKSGETKSLDFTWR